MLRVTRALHARIFIYLIPARVRRLNLSREKAVFPYLKHSSYLRLAIVALHASRTDLRALRREKNRAIRSAMEENCSP